MTVQEIKKKTDINQRKSPFSRASGNITFPEYPPFSSRRHTSPKADLSELLRPACPRAHEDIGAGKQHVKTIKILPDPAIHGFGKPELPLDNQKRMLDHASHGRFPVLDLPLPVDARVVLLYVQHGGSAPDFVLNLRKVFVLFDFVSLLDPCVPGIAVNHFVVFTNQIVRFGDVMCVGRCPCQ